MIDSRLVNYINSQLSKGASLEQIRQKLISSGWQDYQIRLATEWAMQQIIPQTRGATQQINPAVELSAQRTISNSMQTFPSYQESVKKSSNLWILLASGIVLTVGGVLALIILIIKEIVT